MNVYKNIDVINSTEASVMNHMKNISKQNAHKYRRYKLMLLCICCASMGSFSNFTSSVSNRVEAGVNSIENDINNVAEEAEKYIKNAFDEAVQKIMEPVNEMESKMKAVNLNTLINDVESGPEALLQAAKAKLKALIAKAQATVKTDIQSMFEEAGKTMLAAS